MYLLYFINICTANNLEPQAYHDTQGLSSSLWRLKSPHFTFQQPGISQPPIAAWSSTTLCFSKMYWRLIPKVINFNPGASASYGVFDSSIAETITSYKKAIHFKPGCIGPILSKNESNYISIITVLAHLKSPGYRFDQTWTHHQPSIWEQLKTPSLYTDTTPQSCDINTHYNMMTHPARTGTQMIC